MAHAREFHFISRGKVPIGISTAVRDAVASAHGRKLVLALKEDKNFSSNPQRRYYFGVIVPSYLWAFREAGNDMVKGDVHVWLKQEVGQLWRDIVTPDGRPSRILRSYRELSTAEAEEFHTKCRVHAAQAQIDIKEPNEEEWYGQNS